MSKCYVVETVEGIAIQVIEVASDADALVTFEALARENAEGEGFDADPDELADCLNTGIYKNGDYTLSILALDN